MDTKEFIDTMGIEVRKKLLLKNHKRNLEDQFFNLVFGSNIHKQSTVLVLRDYTKDITMESLILAQDER